MYDDLLDDLSDDFAPDLDAGLGASSAPDAFAGADFARSNGVAPPLSAADRARVLVAGETGLRFDSLVLFAEPLFQLYERDPADAFAIKERPDEAPDDVVAVVEASRLLWAFFCLPHAERGRRRSALAVHLLGQEPTDGEWVEFENLIETVEPYWAAMLPEERKAAQQPGHPLLDFDALLAHPAFHLDGDAGDAAHGFGPDGLSDIEARALFAQPLLESEAALADADELEAAMDRANHYWSVARLPASERDAALEAVIREIAAAPREHDGLRAEAESLLARYDALFPSRHA